MAVIDYIELPCTDVDRTKAFYSSVFGWEWVDYGPTYASSTSNAALEIALNGQGQVAPPHAPESQDGIGPLVLFHTQNLDAVESLIRGAGGDITSRPYDYPGGRRLHFADPSGNILGVYEPSTE